LPFAIQGHLSGNVTIDAAPGAPGFHDFVVNAPDAGKNWLKPAGR
jgi:hypothetical protein